MMRAMSSSTADRLRVAAEDLLIEKGQAATTLRDIRDRAEANVAAVNYYFGSKDALIAQVFGDALREVSEVQRRRLADVPDGAPLEDLVRAWLAPAFAKPGMDVREARLWSLIQRGMTERAPALAEAVGAIRDTVDSHLMTRLAAALPHLPPDELMLRHNAVLAAVGGLATIAGTDGEPPSSRQADMLVAWIVGGLTAPAHG